MNFKLIGVTNVSEIVLIIKMFVLFLQNIVNLAADQSETVW